MVSEAGFPLFDLLNANGCKNITPPIMQNNLNDGHFIWYVYIHIGLARYLDVVSRVQSKAPRIKTFPEITPSPTHGIIESRLGLSFRDRVKAF